ncbi:MAG: flavin reductase family protein [Pseudomonadota bacterium]
MNKSSIHKALESIPYGVSVVTVGRGGVENALTVSWMSQVSFDPPCLMIAVDSLHYSVEFLESTRNFTVNLLAEGQTAVAAHFARPSTTEQDKLDKVETREAESGAAILTEAVAYFDCEILQTHKVGGHTLFIGKIIDADVLHAVPPLTTASGIRYRKNSP